MYPEPEAKLSYYTSTKVFFFSHAFDVFNNWSANQVKVWGQVFPTVEHAYQFKKFDLTAPDVAKKIVAAPSPWAAWQIAHQYKAEMRDDWEDLKVIIMTELVKAKLEQNKDVEERLRQSQGQEIVENSPWDSFWGCGEDGLGQNMMGKIWMQLRDELDKPPLPKKHRQFKA